MSKMYFLPFRPAFDSAGVSVPGSQHYFTLAGTNTPSAPFTDAALTTRTENPVVANGIGYLDPIYLDPAISYRVRIYDADATVGVDTPLEEYDPYIPALANADIFSDLAGTDGADLVGTTNGGTLQDFLDKADTKDHGQVAAGVVELWARTKQFSGDTGGTSRIDGLKNTTELDGTHSVDEVRGIELGLQLYHDSAAAITNNAYGLLGYTRIGLNGTKNGTAAILRGIDYHTAIEGTGNVTTIMNFNSGDMDFLVGTGHTTNAYGFRSGNMGHATRVTALAAGFLCDDQTAGATITAGFYSGLGSGTGKWNFLANGSAPSAFSGNVRIGDITAPSDALEVRGFLKASSNGNIGSAGSLHELTNDGSGLAATIRSRHASTPGGLQINFTAASPNNQTQTFLTGIDSTNTKFSIFSDGTINTRGGLLSTGGAGVGYAAGAGGTVTQATSKSTAVILNKVVGQITLNNASLAANTIVSFTLTNSQIAADDDVRVWVKSGNAGVGTYRVASEGNASGSRSIVVENKTAGALAEALVLGFDIIKGVIS
jgi:hypothetical protein